MSRGLVESVLSLKVFTALDYGEILFARNPGKYKDLHSARVQGQKDLNKQVALGQLEKRKRFYCVPSYQGEHKIHSTLLTQSLVKILKRFDATIYREKLIPTVGLLPDSLLLIEKGNEGVCIVLEVIHNESSIYFQNKLNTWRSWDGDLNYLSNLFQVEIPHYSIVTSGQQMPFPEVLTLDEVLEEL
jgi:hypothetical protein